MSVKWFIIWLFCCSSLHSQTVQKTLLYGRVQDEQQNALAYVNIGLPGTTVGTVSNDVGDYQLILTKNIDHLDSIQFSMIGYETKKFSLKEFISKSKGTLSTIVLAQADFELSEVIVRPQYGKTKTVGHSRTSPQRVVNFSIKNKENQNLGAEIAKKFKLPKPVTQLNQFEFFVKHNNFDTIRVRINVYELHKNRPLKNLLKENIIIELTDQQKGWITVDLTPYEIITQKNVAVSIEWIHYSQKGRHFTLPLTFPKFDSIHFYKYGSQSKWKRYKGMSTAMRLQYSY